MPPQKFISAPPATLSSRRACDGLKLGGRVGVGFYAEYPNNPKQAFLHLGIYNTVFQAKVLAISEVAKNLLLEKMHNQTIVALGDSQAAIKVLIKCTVTSITVFNWIRNLNQLGNQNHVSIAWISGHAGVHGYEVADYLAVPTRKLDHFPGEPHGYSLRSLTPGYWPSVDFSDEAALINSNKQRTVLNQILLKTETNRQQNII